MDTATWMAAAEEAVAAGGLADVCRALASAPIDATGPTGHVGDLIAKLVTLKVELAAQLERDVLEAERSNDPNDWLAVLARLDTWLQFEPAHRLCHPRQRLAARAAALADRTVNYAAGPTPGKPDAK